MRYEVIPLDPSHLPAAANLVHRAYQAERLSSPLLPAELLGSRQRILPYLERCLPNGCVGALDGGELVGFMGVSAYFTFKGQKAAFLREYSHAATEKDKLAVYRALYAGLGEILTARRAQLHLIGHFAGDRVLREALFLFGFGALVAENLRNLSPVAGAADVPIIQEPDFAVVETLEIEHKNYYRDPPIFLIKDASPEQVRARLAEQQQAGDVLFVYWKNGEPAAYFTVGPCRGLEEGFLLRDSNTAQILGAYARPDSRGKDIGKALLNRALAWAREQGYARMFVEHETANVYGGPFWRKHFSPFLYFSMRYVEDCWL
jgi:GNAT superfamily N-acetyltransferase